MGPGQGLPAENRGFILVRAGADRAATWVRHGLVAARVVDLGGWSAICPAEATSRAAAPYDDALTLLASRPARRAVRPSIGLFVRDGRAVLTVRPRRWRGAVRWLIWTPDRGAQRPPGLSPVRPGELVRVSPVSGAGAEESLVRVMRQRGGTPLEWLADLMATLELPGGDLLAGGARGRGTLVEPQGRTVARFEALMAEERSSRGAPPPGREAG